MPPKPPTKAAPPPCVPKAKPKPPGPRLPVGDQAEITGPKLRPLFWKSIEQVQPESVWANPVPAVHFDKSLLEKQFAIPESKASGQSTPRGLSNQESRKRVRVLDDKTSHQLAIAFSRLPPPDRLANMVDTLEGFPEGLPREAVLALNSALAEQKEAVEQVQQHIREGGIATLDAPERYLGLIGSVKDADVKLSCGALIVGSANELGDLRLGIEKVGVCSQAIRSSITLQKCVSTSLAVGNVLNRGTARSRANGLVLPEALLKLDELKSMNADKDSPSTAGGNQSALDFIAQALVDEAPHKWESLKCEVDGLLERSRAAQTVSLEESEGHLQRIRTEAQKAKQALKNLGIQEETNFARMYGQVKHADKEAEFASKLMDLAKQEFQALQKWSSLRGPVKSDDWFKCWSQFLEQLVRSVTKARPSAAVLAAPQATQQAAGTPMAASMQLSQPTAAVPPAAAFPPATFPPASTPEAVPKATPPGKAEMGVLHQVQPDFSAIERNPARLVANDLKAPVRSMDQIAPESKVPAAEPLSDGPAGKENVFSNNGHAPLFPMHTS
eukprot:CAMPEP_0178390212 /NCGR_PEP_ID=MMETSP0689_2-20121128/10527_1 /TAXON_ID=160604 /ORGANISM="Amphidinium massartii, Strain CS-259" /LENGTH=556 /DNA_ID=CAMNT_0020010709 /DNA_START=21 /DNA_END=1691 /DNA_ORIENTATION=-